MAIRSPQNLFMLEKALAETDPETTEVVVMTAKWIPPGERAAHAQGFDRYDQQLMTAVVTLAEKAGKEATPLILPTNNPLYAIVNTAATLQAQELILGASNQYSPDEQLEQIAFYWINVHQGVMEPLTVRILSRNRDVYLDLGGGNRIPKISERQARSVAELRSAGVGVSHAMLVHADTPESSDLFKAVLTMLDPQVALTVVPVPLAAEAGREPPPAAADGGLSQFSGTDAKRRPENGTVPLVDTTKAGCRRTSSAPSSCGAKWPSRSCPSGAAAEELVRLAAEQDCDVLIIGLPSQSSPQEGARWTPTTLSATLPAGSVWCPGR